MSCSTARTVAMLGLLASAFQASAQAPVAPAATWEVRFTSGALVATGAERNTLKDAEVSAAQVSWLIRPSLAITSTIGWARSRDLSTLGDPKLDVFTYDVGAEGRTPELFSDKRVTLAPFIGAGIGARSYNYRTLDVDATHNLAAYAATGGELGMGRVGVRVEVRDYVTGFKPLGDIARSATRNDVVFMLGLRFKRSADAASH